MSGERDALAETESRWDAISEDAWKIAEDVWSEEEPTLAEYELTQRILDVMLAQQQQRAGTTVTEWGVFRLDTGEQVGLGTTERRANADDDLHAWRRDGFEVELRSRPVSEWTPVEDGAS